MSGAALLNLNRKAMHPRDRLLNLSRAGQGQGKYLLQQARESHADLLEHAPIKLEQANLGIPAGFRGLGDKSLLEAADLTTSTAGVLNKVFGGDFAWMQVNTQDQIAASLPSSVRSRGSPYGWRAITDFGSSSSKGGQSEGTVPTAVVNSFAEVAPTIIEHSTQMRTSLLQQGLVDVDDALGSLVTMQSRLAIEHAKERERAVTEDVDTLAGVHSESVDRVTASSANQATIGWTAGDEDIFGIDRSANTWADAVQDVAATARTLTKKLIKGVLRQVHQNGGNTSFIGTGYDTWEALSTLYEPQGRVDIGIQQNLTGGSVGGAEVLPGQAVSEFVSFVEGRPVVASDQAHADSSELSRMYFLDIGNPEAADKPRLGWDVLLPTRVFAAGAGQGAPQNISFVGDSLLAVSQYQLGCHFFKAQGQLRDTTAP